MTGMPQAKADTNPVGRHGQIDVDIFPREFSLPTFESEAGSRPQLQEEIGITALSAISMSEQIATRVIPRAEKPVEAPGFYL